jgi:hypothetical protein
MNRFERDRLHAAIQTEQARRRAKHYGSDRASNPDPSDRPGRKRKKLALIIGIVLTLAVLVPAVWICALYAL